MDHALRIFDSEYLSDVLRRAGALTRGRVTRVEAGRTLTKFRSQSMRLRLHYTEDAASAPASLFLKTSLTGGVGASEMSVEPREVAFYREISPLMATGLVPRCFEANWQPETREWHLLLEDLTDTHFVATVWPLPPTSAQCETILQARAHAHAAWWDDARLGNSVGRKRDASVTQRLLQSFERQVARFVDQYRELVPPERLLLFEHLIDQAPRLAARYESGRNVTVIHGDAHVWNCFLRREGGRNDVRLFDWEDWRVSIATDDLAYMMAVHWYPDRRRRLEQQLLDFYHAHLLSDGVSGYDRQAMEDDYRLSVLWHLLTPVWQAAHNIPPGIWWNNLERIMLAIDDLGCRDLLQR